MKVYYGVDEFPQLKGVVLTMGTFDGVHYGHRKILKRLLESAKVNNGHGVVMTFHPHPRTVLFPDQTDLRLLSTVTEKIELLASLGIEHLIVQPFTLDFSKLTHREFVQGILIDKINMQCMVVGYDHQFGHKRQGNFDELLKLSTDFGFEVEKIPEQDIDEVVVSSTKIRNALLTGNVSLANQLLSYNYSLSGEVVKGNQVGRTLGFPTANIYMSDNHKLIPGDGVYSALAFVDGVQYKSVVSIGNRPTFNDSKKSIEVHLLNFNQDLYNQNLKIEFVDFIRPQRKFEVIDELVQQINADIALAMEHLS
jgi:riboflavin kinase/FMN adenylyltransferase